MVWTCGESEGNLGKQHMTHCWRLLRRVIEHIGKYDTLLEIVKKRKLRWFGHVVRVKGTLANTILQGKVEGKDSGWTM